MYNKFMKTNQSATNERTNVRQDNAFEEYKNDWNKMQDKADKDF